MRKIGYFILFFIFVSWATTVSAQEDQKDEIPVGMERIRTGDAHNILVPLGTKINKEGGVLIIETIDKYAARRFVQVDERLAKIESDQEQLKREIKELKEALDKLNPELLKKEIRELKESLNEIKDLKKTEPFSE